MDMHDTLYLDAAPVDVSRASGCCCAPTRRRCRSARCRPSPPPIRVVIPGMVYRATPSMRRTAPAFSQIEGLAVDEGISFVDLKATLTPLRAPVLRRGRPTSRFRPSFFPFTEPSAEMDVECQLCDGTGCPACKGTGWMEILGCGMVHPAVLENCGIDPERYTGLGLRDGPARIAMLRYGIPDIRLLFDGDMRFLAQFARGIRMNVSRRWLEAFLRRSLDATEVEQLLTAHRRPVDADRAAPRGPGGDPHRAGDRGQAHPNADRLRLCLVDTGGAEGPLDVVCGAPNVTAGKCYPFAPVGATLPGGVKLERRKIRGIASKGMLCSARELGLGQDHEGILELETDAAPGTRFLDAVPIGDDRILLDVYANRPDLLCHKGVARELAAALGGTVKLPAFPGAPADPSAYPPIRRSDLRGVVDGVEIRLEDPEGAPRYMIAVIRGVRVGPSPAWLADRLDAVGQRSINNVVDATNYVLFELNQPMHAFDLARLRGPAVVVRRAHQNEKIVTLDGIERTLTAEMTAICDAERPTIVAGVMGSAETEVTESTTDLVLECAYFQPTRIRRTRRALGLSSEASYRFERGIDRWGCPTRCAAPSSSSSRSRGNGARKHRSISGPSRNSRAASSCGPSGRSGCSASRCRDRSSSGCSRAWASWSPRRTAASPCRFPGGGPMSRPRSISSRRSRG